MHHIEPFATPNDQRQLVSLSPLCDMICWYESMQSAGTRHIHCGDLQTARGTLRSNDTQWCLGAQAPPLSCLTYPKSVDCKYCLTPDYETPNVISHPTHACIFLKVCFQKVYFLKVYFLKVFFIGLKCFFF